MCSIFNGWKALYPVGARDNLKGKIVRWKRNKLEEKLRTCQLSSARKNFQTARTKSHMPFRQLLQPPRLPTRAYLYSKPSLGFHRPLPQALAAVATRPVPGPSLRGTTCPLGFHE